MKRILRATMTVSWLLANSQALAEPDEGAKLVARELMAKGRAQRDSADFAGALASFSKAHAIMHVPTTLLEAARARADVGQWLEALELIRELESLPASAGEPAPFARARGDALELARSLAERMPRLRVDLSGAPQGLPPLLTVDGEPRPECASGCFVNPGLHVVVARTPRTMGEEQLTLAEHDQQQLELVFSPLAAPVGRGGAEPAQAALTDARASSVPTATWISGGVALAGLAAGTALGLSAVHRRDELRESCAPHCSTEDVERARRQMVLANVAFGVGFGAAAVAVVSYVLSRPAPASRPAQGLKLAVSPAPDARGGNVALGGRF